MTAEQQVKLFEELSALAARGSALPSPASSPRCAYRSGRTLPQPHGIHGQCAEVLWGVNDEEVLVLLGKLSGGAAVKREEEEDWGKERWRLPCRG
jgi:hypothetical protein